MKRIAAVVVISLCATTIFASGLSQKYKDWARSPQAYFMTKAEQTQWSHLQSDAEAEQFVNDFAAKRGGDAFVREVAQNAAQADKYLTIGKTPGSLTARGKMMILLGPAAPTNVAKKKKAGDVRLAPPVSMGDFSGATVEQMQSASSAPGNSTTFVNEYTYAYPASALPSAYGKPLTVKIEVDSGAETDRVASYGNEKELDKLYEMVAQAKLAAAKPATP
jgi:GWxTD domain-containing protein